MELNLVHNAMLGQAPLRLQAPVGFEHTKVLLSVLTNKQALRDGEELVLYAAPSAREMRPQRRERTWRDSKPKRESAA